MNEELDFFAVEKPEDWILRRQEAESIERYLREHYGDPGATERLIPYVKDEKWEVRLVVARAVASVNEGALSHFQPLLSDCNAHVLNCVSHSMQQRNLYVKSREKQEKDESKIFHNLEKIRKKFGPEAAKLAREEIEDAYQLTVGYAIHDIRGMVTPISDNLKQMCNIAQNELTSLQLVKFNQARDAIIRRVDMIVRMAEDMKVLSKKTPKVRMQECVQEMIQAAVNDTRDIFSAKDRDISGVKFVMDGISRELAVPVARDSIIRVFINLLKNAVESYMITPEKSGSGTVEISARRVQDGVEIVIRDHGVGLDAADLKRYRMFLPRSSSKKTTGTGLGLAIAYAKIKDHGGTLEIDSEGIGKGLTATIYLPGEKNELGIFGARG